MHDERQEWISKRAYGLWEAEGRPHGKDHEHWEQAARERVELEKVALPGHLKKDRAPRKPGSGATSSPEITGPAPSRGGNQDTSARH